MGNGRIYLGGAYVLVPKQFADCFNRHALRQRNRRGESMARRMERNRLQDAGAADDFFQADVAPPVARKVENTLVACCGAYLSRIL